VKLDNDYPLVIFVIKDSQYAISAKFVSNMVAVPDTRPVPHAPSYVRGIINLRGKVLPLVDLRMRLGFESAASELNEFYSMLNQREQDHRNWLNELEASVDEERDFPLTSDPHKCAFGKWYDTYETNDLSAKAILRKFDRPHKRIHALAHHVEEFQAQGNFDGARKVIEEGREKDLKRMIKLFASVQNHFSESAREIAMIVETPEFDYAVAIDMVSAVEFLAPGTTEKLPAGLDNGQTNNLVALIGRRESDNSSVQILDSGRICDPQEVKGLITRENMENDQELQPA
jgi:chemotaxis signal transduction protein